jgi:hypothetical protein
MDSGKRLLLGFVVLLSAQLASAQGSCTGRAQPVYVPRQALSCPAPHTICTCGSDGAGCHYEWACPLASSSADRDSDLIKKAQQLQPAPARKSDDKSPQTWNLGNGRMWVALANDDQRLLYLTGIQEGARRSAAESGFQNGYATRFGDRPASETVQALTRFYADADNLTIPVLDALTIVTMRTNGSRPEDVERQLSILRDVASQAPERQR